MNEQDRQELINFCISVIADLNGVDVSDVEPGFLMEMSDDELIREADWLENLLNK